LAAYGFTEVLNFSLIGLESLARLSPDNGQVQPLVRVDNPMTVDMEYLRPNFRANLFASFAANRRHEEGSILLFEVGKIYLPCDKDLPDERDIVCGVMGGFRYALSWQDNDPVLDFFDAKGIMESLMQRLSVDVHFEKENDPGLHPINKQQYI
jgi:phenylalanyl-tRNA synthetase beta chain